MQRRRQLRQGARLAAAGDAHQGAQGGGGAETGAAPWWKDGTFGGFLRKNLGKCWDFYGKYGKTWENLRKIWKNAGKNGGMSSGNPTKNDGKWKITICDWSLSTISMAMFNSYMSNYQRV